jgi:hypothetical protein
MSCPGILSSTSRRSDYPEEYDVIGWYTSASGVVDWAVQSGSDRDEAVCKVFEQLIEVYAVIHVLRRGPRRMSEPLSPATLDKARKRIAALGMTAEGLRTFEIPPDDDADVEVAAADRLEGLEEEAESEIDWFVEQILNVLDRMPPDRAGKAALEAADTLEYAASTASAAPPPISH